MSLFTTIIFCPRGYVGGFVTRMLLAQMSLSQASWTISQICEKRLLTLSCLSVHPYSWKKLCSHWTHFKEILYLSIFRKFVEKIQDLLQSYSSNRHCIWTSMYINVTLSPSSNYNEKCFRQKLYRKPKTVLGSISLFTKNRAVYEIMCKNITDPDRPLLTIWRMCLKPG
jgi:hypothetical protein